MNRNSGLREMEPIEELSFLREIYGRDGHEKILQALIESYNVLQGRAQTLLSLITIILTIAGFSGPNIASSSGPAKVSVGVGLIFVLLSAIVTLWGPLQLKWATQTRAESIDASLVSLIERRNARTRKYHAAFVLLVTGMAGYVGGLISYVFRL
jgi:hypothetical protein